MDATCRQASIKPLRCSVIPPLRRMSQVSPKAQMCAQPTCSPPLWATHTPRWTSPSAHLVLRLHRENMSALQSFGAPVARPHRETLTVLHALTKSLPWPMLSFRGSTRASCSKFVDAVLIKSVAAGCAVSHHPRSHRQRRLSPFSSPYLPRQR